MGASGEEPNVTPEETLAVFTRDIESGTPLSTAEVAEQLDCSPRTAERNLMELTSRGELESKQVSDGGEVVWWNPQPSLPTSRETHEWREEIYERITDAFYALDDEWRFTHLNERAEELLQHSKEELLGKSIWEEFPEATDTIVWDKYHEAMENQKPVDFDLYYEPLDIWAEVNVYPSETGLSVYFLDVTEHIESEQQLERYRRIVETINDGVYAVDSDGRFTMVNEAYTEMLGYDREELVGEHVSKIVSEEVAERAQEVEREQVAGEREAPTLEAELETADGETIVAEATFALLTVQEDDYERIGVVRDVTERREYERMIDEQRKRYRRLVEAAPVAIVTCDAEGRIVFANEAATEQVATSDGLVGESAVEFVHPDDRDGAAERLRRVLEEREPVSSTEIKLLTPDGDVRHAITTSVPITHDGEPAAQIVLTDITARKRTEEQLNQLVEELEESNERLDSFASMLAHELRSPLNVAEIYLQQVESDDAAAKEQVADALDRIEGMIDVLLVLAKGSDAVSRAQTVSLRAVAHDAWETVDPESATLVVETDRSVRGDPNHLQHLLENVFQNAVEHGSPTRLQGGDGPPPADEELTIRVGDLDTGFYVADDGVGIPESEREEVFEAGYSTDDDGLGLGLTFVAQLTDAYGWGCAATESEDGGARFEFTDVDLAD